MSARRARIKAVASLPVRRKNNEGPIKTNKPLSPQSHEETDTTSDPQVMNENKQNSVQKKVILASPKSAASVESRLPTPKSVKIVTPQFITSPNPRKASPIIKFVGSPNTGLVRSPAVVNTVAQAQDKLVQGSQIISRPSSVRCIEERDDVEGISSISNYESPSIPESITAETVLDGIVPLKATQNATKPIDILKNEIISDTVEVSFDPIIPLPSPSKVRPKLRPVPRLFRRNSIQGSASESEDENRRALLSSAGSSTPGSRQRHDSHSITNRELARVRNDSVSSVVSQATTQHSKNVPASPLREKHFTKVRRSEQSRRMSALRRRQRARDDVKRTELTMYDLIFYNPTANPIVNDEENQPVSKEVETPAEPPATIEDKTVTEEDPDDPAADTQDTAPVPQIKLGPNGEIILDEQSLVIEQTEPTRKLSMSVVHESAWASAGKGKYSRAKKSADWSSEETVRFYRALAAVGTDFTLMGPMFPDRTRRDLKVKFKKEERVNGAQVDKALCSQTEWDGITLENVFAEERKEAKEKAARELKAYSDQRKLERTRLRMTKEAGFRTSRASRAIESTVLRNPGPSDTNEAMTADDIIRKALEDKKNMRQKSVKQAKLRPTLTPKPTALATLTPILKDTPIVRSNTLDPHDRAVITHVNTPKVSGDIETGSLVVFTVNDPNEPSKKMLQTYISHGAGKLTPVALPASLLNSVVGYMKKGTPKSSGSTCSSPLLHSPSSVASLDSSRSSSVIQINPSPAKRQRHNSYNITTL